ncbi:hypothetical protein [Kangiella spongicola]|uniref:Uncharacterized protein n=1 Tax=Kangiella spongicola TaxID=796379 RepID=A0A318D7Y4_9GAMM|nr:hypothetical protein [Kangiella spongicola]PXF63908.1 hypothetical protein DL796_01840 [Kangiella spongicola]
MRRILVVTLFAVTVLLSIIVVGIWEGQLFDGDKNNSNEQVKTSREPIISSSQNKAIVKGEVKKESTDEINNDVFLSQPEEVISREQLIRKYEGAETKLKVLEKYLDNIDYHALSKELEVANKIKLNDDIGNIRSYYSWQDENGTNINAKSAFSTNSVGKAYNSEVRDHNWAAQRESEISSEVYSKFAELGDKSLTLDEVNCKKSVCKVNLRSLAKGVSDERIKDIANSVSVDNKVMIAPFTYHYRKDGEVDIYLSRYVPSLRSNNNN